MPTYATHKRARFDYEILEKIEAGLLLLGHEVKSIRNKQIKLTGAYVSIRGGECFLRQAHISAYPYAIYTKPYDPERERKLLLSKREIAYIEGKLNEKGLTIVPLSLYSKGSHIKMEIGIAKGKKQYDKRHVIKKRDLDRDLRREMRGRV